LKIIKDSKIFKGVAFKFAIVSWILIIVTLTFFIAFSLPYQSELIIERMENEAKDITYSIVNANQSALITEEYSFIVEQCLQLVKESNSIKYLVINKNDGLSLIFTEDGWKVDTLSYSREKESEKKFDFIHSNIVNDDVFHYSYNYNYSGIDWGWIFVGLSLENYNKALFNLTLRTILIALVLIVFGFVTSIIFTRRITNPIRVLDGITRQVADGNLNVKANLTTNDELQNLSESFNYMTKSLKTAKDTLEKRVEERTAELAETNEALKNEIKERLKIEEALNKYNFRLVVLQQIYRGIIKARSVKDIAQETLLNLHSNFLSFKRASVCLYDIEKNLVTVFSVFEDSENNVKHNTESYPLSDLTMAASFNEKGFRIVNDLDAVENKSNAEKMIYEIGIRSYATFKLIFQEKLIGELNIGDGDKKRYSEDDINIVFEISNTLAVAIAQAYLQENIKKHAETLQKSLKEKLVLLKEVHHRVKNNLQVISSLLYLQAKKSSDENVLKTLLDSQNRVKSMALVHEKIYKSSDFSKVDVSDYIKSLAEIIISSFSETSKKIDLILTTESIFLPIDISIPFGLIVNEVLTNIVKHAFKDRKKGSVNISLAEVGDKKIMLIIKDDGKGLPEDFEEKSKSSLGMQLIHNLTSQINGEMTYTDKNGTELKLIFEKPLIQNTNETVN
jgi:two-component sensor histidine kinase/HAMP domain-containing protein